MELVKENEKLKKESHDEIVINRLQSGTGDTYRIFQIRIFNGSSYFQKFNGSRIQYLIYANTKFICQIKQQQEVMEQ